MDLQNRGNYSRLVLQSVFLEQPRSQAERVQISHLKQNPGSSRLEQPSGARVCVVLVPKCASYDERSVSFSAWSFNRASVLRATTSITNTEMGIPANNKASVKTGFVPNVLSSHNPPKTEARMMISVRHPTCPTITTSSVLRILLPFCSDC